MAYTINKTNGTTFAIIADGAADFSSGLALLGKNYPNYGTLIAGNFLALIENQANSVPPLNPVTGQLWWDTSVKQMKWFDGDRFKTVATSNIGSDYPLAPQQGDMWWDTANKQLHVFDGTWILIGPAATP